MSHEVNQEQIKDLIEDATYLQDEAEALRYVIDSVPYEESTPSDPSILDKLLLLDHLQVNYYRPVFNQVDSKPGKNVRVKDFSIFCEKFTADKDEKPDIQSVLGKLSKHRAALINIFRQIPLIDWEHEVYKDNHTITLYLLARDLVTVDRRILKEIADMVMVFQKDSQSRREINRKLPKEEQTQNNR